MRILKLTLVVVALSTFAILFGIGFVWRELAFTTHTIEQAPSNAPAKDANAVSSSTDAATEVEEISSTAAPVVQPTPLAEPVTVKTSDLPAAQRTVLETLGMDDASITITPSMVQCAIDGLGAERVTAIQKGEAPSLSEGLTLIACMKK